MCVKSPGAAVMLWKQLGAVCPQLKLSEVPGSVGDIDEDLDLCIPLWLQPSQKSVGLPQVLTNTWERADSRREAEESATCPF